MLRLIYPISWIDQTFQRRADLAWVTSFWGILHWNNHRSIKVFDA